MDWLLELVSSRFSFVKIIIHRSPTPKNPIFFSQPHQNKNGRLLSPLCRLTRQPTKKDCPQKNDINPKIQHGFSSIPNTLPCPSAVLVLWHTAALLRRMLTLKMLFCKYFLTIH